jgi:hypothetical protein
MQQSARQVHTSALKGHLLPVALQLLCCWICCC